MLVIKQFSRGIMNHESVEEQFVRFPYDGAVGKHVADGTQSGGGCVNSQYQHLGHPE